MRHPRLSLGDRLRQAAAAGPASEAARETYFASDAYRREQQYFASTACQRDVFDTACRRHLARTRHNRTAGVATTGRAPGAPARARERRDSGARTTNVRGGNDPPGEPPGGGDDGQAWSDAHDPTAVVVPTALAAAAQHATDVERWSCLLAAPSLKRPDWRTPSVHDAIRDGGLLAAWIADSPGVGLAVNLGASHLAVIEDDGPEGLAALAELEARHGPLSATREIQARRGKHRVYRTRGRVPSRRLGPELELRAWGEYVLLPPTMVDGVTRRWLHRDRLIAPLPSWVTALANATRVSHLGPAPKVDVEPGAAHVALSEAMARLMRRPATRGTGRGTALFAASCELGRYVAAGVLDDELVRAELHRAGARLGLSAYERSRSIDRGLIAGPQRTT